MWRKCPEMYNEIAVVMKYHTKSSKPESLNKKEKQSPIPKKRQKIAKKDWSVLVEQGELEIDETYKNIVS